MRLFWRILAGIGSLVLLLLIAVAIAISTVDVKTFIGPVQTRVKDSTGRDLTVGGDIDLKFSLEPKLVVQDVALSNAPWAGLSWNGLIANDGDLAVNVSTSHDGANFTPLQPITLENSVPNTLGRYLKVVVDFIPATSGEGPILHDLNVGTLGWPVPPAIPAWEISAGGIQCDERSGKWRAHGRQRSASTGETLASSNNCGLCSRCGHSRGGSREEQIRRYELIARICGR